MGPALSFTRHRHDRKCKLPVVALAGTPIVVNSTLFNALTGLHQHTGNWPGKTVVTASGVFRYDRQEFEITDLPGTYSLLSHSPEEEAARDYILSGEADVVIVVCDAVCLERSLNLFLQVTEICRNVIVCVNLMDEAERKGIKVDIPLLSALLGVPAIGITARRKKTLGPLLEAVKAAVAERRLDTPSLCDQASRTPEDRAAESHRIYSRVVTAGKATQDRFDRTADRILTGRRFGYPMMALLLSLVLWLTIVGANYPSQLLAGAMSRLEAMLSRALVHSALPQWLCDALILGVYRMLSWVISVMLPPMAIFFPLFTLLEDIGYLPRIAFNLDKSFQCCGACGKQALTMTMGLGCNAAAVVGCRIIDSPRERLLAVITNSFVPCNGRFPMLLSLLTMFFVTGSSLLSAILLTVLILLGTAGAFLATAILSRTVLKGSPSFFTLELPPYRRPQPGQILVRSLLDRTLFVLGRAAAVAAPAGLLLWCLANIHVGSEALLQVISAWLDPAGRLLGMDGVILLAFILGWPANETVIPIMLMIYLSLGSLSDGFSAAQIHTIFVSNGWTVTTAGCVLLFTVFHWPCSTTLLTVRKATGSIRWMLLSAILPTVFGVLACFCLRTLAALFSH